MIVLIIGEPAYLKQNMLMHHNIMCQNDIDCTPFFIYIQKKRILIPLSLINYFTKVSVVVTGNKGYIKKLNNYYGNGISVLRIMLVERGKGA